MRERVSLVVAHRTAMMMIVLMLISNLLAVAALYHPVNNNYRHSLRIYESKDVQSPSEYRPEWWDDTDEMRRPSTYPNPASVQAYYDSPIDFSTMKPDDPRFVDMAWPTELGPHATAFARHLQWRRRLTDGESKYAFTLKYLVGSEFYGSLYHILSNFRDEVVEVVHLPEGRCFRYV